ncbi:molybdenum cofactor biosynthesis protein MoaE [Qipengyuania sp. 902]|uniref:molybdenum cofactor biosynthesis protein MoaE n=1 Tax=Qipengyuania sp. 902 TaxID=3417565 RepID=UPI003EBF09F8
MMRAVVRHGRLDPAAELATLTGESKEAGGVVSFVGLAREEDGAVAELILEHHPVLTERSLEEIATAALERFGVNAVSVVHRAGRIMPGEPIVFAGAAARHRREAFLAADYLMDMLKTRAAFWKREDGPAGPRWIEPRDEDHSDAARWRTENGRNIGR